MILTEQMAQPEGWALLVPVVGDKMQRGFCKWAMGMCNPFFPPTEGSLRGQCHSPSIQGLFYEFYEKSKRNEVSCSLLGSCC